MTSPLKRQLDAETRNWWRRGVIPSVAAADRRRLAELVATQEARDWHLAVAAEWDRLAAKYPDRVIAVLTEYRDQCIGNLANHEPGSELAKYWQDRAATYDRAILAIGPDAEF